MKIDFKESKILITGGNGFIGSHLANRLSSLNLKSEVHLLDIFARTGLNSLIVKRKNLHFHEVNLVNYEKIEEIVRVISPDFVFHLGAFLNPNREFRFLKEAISVNIIGTSNLLQALRNLPISMFIHMGTSEIYGQSPSPFDELTPINPTSPYSASKASSEIFTRFFSSMYDLPVTFIRSFNVFGEGQSPKMLIPQVILHCIQEKDIELSAGNQIRDSIYVEDVVDGLILSAIHKGKSRDEIFNLGSGKGYTIKDLVNKIISMMGSRINPLFGSLQYRNLEIMEMVSDSTKAERILGWKPKQNLDQGLKKTIDWYKSST